MFWNNLKGTIEYWWRRKKLTKEEQKKFDDFNYLDKSISFEDLKKDREKFINFFYSNPEEALLEFKRRNKKIKNKLIKKPKGFIHRDITPNIEINRMLGICDALDLEPLILDNPNDKFSCLSRPKYRLAKLSFLVGYNKNGELLYEHKKIIDFKNIEGKKLNKIKTFEGFNLIDFHKNWFLSIYPDLKENILDVSKLVFRNKAKKIYKKIFSISTCDGFLIESFVLFGKEADFIESIIFNSFMEVWQKTKLKPIVIPSDLLDIEEEEEYWLSYVNKLK